MQRETNEHIKKVINAIKNILKTNNLPTTPDNIIKYTISSIISLLDDQDTDNVKDLLSVLFVYQDFLQEEVDELICKLIDNGLEDKAFRIIKILLNSGRDAHIDILLKYYLGDVNKSKMFNMINYCFEKSENIEILIKSISKFMENCEDLEKLRIFNTFFEKIYPQIDFKDILNRTIEFIDNNVKVKEEQWKVVFGVLYKYVLWIGEVNKDYNFYIEEIKYTLNILKKTEECGFVESSLVLRILGKIIELDRIFYFKTKSNIILIDKEFKNLIKGLVFYEDTTYKSIEEFFTSAKHIIIPDFIDITRELCGKFNNEQHDKIMSILNIIACHIGISQLCTIMNDKMDYIKWIPILNSTSNNDLSIFVDIYNRVDDKDKIYTLIPSFCNYPTDDYDKLGPFLDIIVECLNNKLYYGISCSGIRNLITSHEMNLNKTCILRNPIDKALSTKILNHVCSTKMFFTILKNYGNEQLPKEVLFSITRRLDDPEMNRFAGLFVENIIKFPESSPMIINKILISDFKECLNYAKFFTKFMKLTFDFPSKILEICSSDNAQIQKKAYELLYYLEKENKIEICVCEHINGKDLLNNLKPSSLKYKLLYLSIPRTCNCGVNRKDCLLQNVIMSFSPKGNISSRRVSEDIISNVFLGTDTESSTNFIEYIMKGLKSNNLEITSGCLSTFNHILHRYSTSITYDTQKSAYDFVFESYKSINALVILKILSTFIKHTDGVVDDRLVKILEYYVETKKRKYRSDIKEVVNLLLSKQMTVSRSLKKYTNFWIPTNKQTLTITKNNEIIITEETKKI